MALTKVTGQVIKNTTDVTVGVLTVTNTLAVGGTVSIGGTLTYEDVTNVDAVGLITARNGIVVGSGITLSKDGDVFFTGIATGNGSGLTALNASNLASGTVPTARLGSGTASSSTFLRGDSTFQTVNTDLVSDTSPQLGGDLASNGNDIIFADNDKAIFGTGSDLKIYHNGTHNYFLNSNGDYVFDTGSSELARLNSSGQIGIGANNNSDYDSSARNVLIANSSGSAGVTIRSSSSGYGMIHFADGTSSAAEYRAGRLLYEHSSNSFLFYGANAFKLKINSDGDVGIGDNSPASRLTVTEDNASGDVGIRVKNDTATDGSATSPTTASLYLNTSTATFNTLYIQARRYDNDTWFGYGDPTSAGHIPTLCLTNHRTVGINTHVPRCNGQNAAPGLHIVGRGIDPSPHYDAYSDLIVESIESRIQITSASGGTNASSLIMSSAVDANDNKHWVLEAAGSSQSYKFHLGYLETTSTNFDSGSVTPDISINTVGRIEHVPVDNLFYTSSVAGAVRLQFNHTGGGNITISNPSTGNVTYDTSSDYRLKENVGAISNALTTVKALKPYQFTWKHDSQIGQGFFAHEAQSVLPDAGIVSGTKDAVHSEDDLDLGVKAGDPIYQGIDYSKLVPLLTAALQEEIAKREALEARIDALEG